MNLIPFKFESHEWKASVIEVLRAHLDAQEAEDAQRQ